MSGSNNPVNGDAASPESVPYLLIARVMNQGKAVVFLGSACSRIGRGNGDIFDPNEPKFLPDGKELSLALANEAGFPSPDDWDRKDLAKVSSYYEEVSGRAELRGRLRGLLHPSGQTGQDGKGYEPNSLHRMLARIKTPQIIVTTNYDTLIEQAFDDAKRPYHLVIYPAEKNDFNGVLLRKARETEFVEQETQKLEWWSDFQKSGVQDATVIYKMHGSISPRDPSDDYFVITEDDYVRFISRMIMSNAIPPAFMTEFSKRSFLFLGYSLQDWNLRVLLQHLRSPAARLSQDRRHWAIQLTVKPLDKMLWSRRQVMLFDETLDLFVQKLMPHL